METIMTQVQKNTTTSENVPVEILIYPYINGLKDTSTRIRYLASQGILTKEIHLILNIRYQHVRNVLNQVLKKK